MRPNGRRETMDIMADILRVASEPVRKTRIVYQANLNFEIIPEYLERLTERGLIRREGDRYHTTQQGRRFIDDYARLSAWA